MDQPYMPRNICRECGGDAEAAYREAMAVALEWAAHLALSGIGATSGGAERNAGRNEALDDMQRLLRAEAANSRRLSESFNPNTRGTVGRML